jgi:DNA polymerase III delta prime subunit
MYGAHDMSAQQLAKQLFDYISHVLAIDLPVTRDVTAYRAELWWQIDLVPCSQCAVREFNASSTENEQGNGALTQPDPWLSVLKRPIENPPQPPSEIRDWVTFDPSPENPPQSKPSILKRERFSDSKARIEAFRTFATRWKTVLPSDRARMVPVPDLLLGWVDASGSVDDVNPMTERETEERFLDDPRRVSAFAKYIDGQWRKWADRVTPFYHANVLYDQLYALHQRLSVEGDRIEILWGHLLFAWDHGPGEHLYHPLFLTPMNLVFDDEGAKRRQIKLIPSNSQPTKIDLECLRDLEYPNKDKILDYAQKMNESDSPADVWSHVQMKAVSNTLTGLLSAEAAEVTNRYTDLVAEKPTITLCPVIHNAPVIFVRQRARHFWIDDAKKVAAAIERGDDIPPFIKALVGDPGISIGDVPSVSAPDHADEDGGELFFPLEYNDQQREIWDKIQGHFGVLVQGPPGTGKSHTIANVISALLARGKRVLVTSQTENALKVLRNLVPEDIRDLCISQLGNDIESKTQLHQAVQAIGKRLADKTSNVPEQRIHLIRQDLRTVREEQAVLRNQIRDWAELDSKTLPIDGQQITAEQGAKEYAQFKDACAWLIDQLDSDAEPPLTNAELVEFCGLLKEVTAAEQISSVMYLPEKIESPETMARHFTELKAADEIAAVTEEARADWQNALRQAGEERLLTAIQVLEDGMRELHELNEEWQHVILGLIASDPKNGAFWNSFLKTCEEHYSAAFEAFQKSQTYDIEVLDLSTDVDVEVALSVLDVVIQRGRNPNNMLVWPFLHKSAKCLFKAVKVDGKTVSTPDRLAAVKAYFLHKDRMAKFERYWRKSLEPVAGPMANDSAPMPVADAGERIKRVGKITKWANQHLGKLGEQAEALGCPASRRVCHCEDTLTGLLSVLHGQLAVLKRDQICESLRSYEDALRKERTKPNAHPLWEDFAGAVVRRSAQEYEKAWKCLQALLVVRPKAERIEALRSRLAAVAPLWAFELIECSRECGPAAIPSNWQTAWRVRRLVTWLNQLHAREGIESLQKRQDRCRRREQGLIARLVHERTWQRQIRNVKPEQHQALAAWADAMRKYGKGTGKYAPYWLNAASRAMHVAQGAVPVWIMPLFRVVELFAAEPGIFDVVVVDEASQCDIRALPVLFRGKKVLVVGDPEQISPAGIGVPFDKVMEQIRMWLNGVPYPERFFINNSLYAITGTLPHMDRTLLSEHFRCVPEIIEFNNRLCPTYGGNLEPLRQPNPEWRLEPSICTAFIEGGFKNNSEVNESEAEALVNKLVECCRDPRYSKGGKDGRKRTMGVISLLGEGQAKHISILLSQRLDETEREERRIICGDAYAFQGDERDVMFLSMVIATNESFAALVKEDARQRFNVATSRARDQVFLFHSVKLSDIKNPECVRYKLLAWYLNPPLLRMQTGLETLKERADSAFEIDVGEIIIRRGYRVIPQLEPLKDRQYRIDLVVQGQKSRLAVECDGDRWHGQDKWEDDQKRETQLRRAGWSFWRVSSSAFYRDRETALSSLWERLDDLGITPENLWVQPEAQPVPLPTVQTDVVSKKTATPAESAAVEDDSFASVQDETLPDRLGAALDYAQKKVVDIREVSIVKIQQALVALLRREHKRPLSRDNVAARVCKELGFHPSGRSKELFERKSERALQHLVDRGMVDIHESGTIRFAFQNDVGRQKELNLGSEGMKAMKLKVKYR